MSKTSELLSLSDIHSRTGISYPTLIKYKNNDPRIRRHMVGEGRTAKFREPAVKVFEKARVEGLARRGRPAKG